MRLTWVCWLWSNLYESFFKPSPNWFNVILHAIHIRLLDHFRRNPNMNWLGYLLTFSLKIPFLWWWLIASLFKISIYRCFKIKNVYLFMVVVLIWKGHICIIVINNLLNIYHYRLNCRYKHTLNAFGEYQSLNGCAVMTHACVLPHLLMLLSWLWYPLWPGGCSRLFVHYTTV